MQLILERKLLQKNKTVKPFNVWSADAEKSSTDNSIPSSFYKNNHLSSCMYHMYVCVWDWSFTQANMLLPVWRESLLSPCEWKCCNTTWKSLCVKSVEKHTHHCKMKYAKATHGRKAITLVWLFTAFFKLYYSNSGEFRLLIQTSLIYTEQYIINV